MRILTVIAGILLAAAGAFCFAFNTVPFSGLAFPVGVAMVAAAVLILIAFISAGRGARPSDTMLVEAIVSFLFGFAVLNDQVQETMLVTFFGAWIAIAGGNRISQSLSVSRHSPRDWFKIMPLALLDALLGAVMMMPTLTTRVVSAPPVMLVALAFIINGLSLLVYAMYMKTPDNIQAQQEAISRAEAKKAAAEAKRRRRAELRSLSREERLEAEALMKAEKKTSGRERRLARKAEKEAAREARRPELERTVELSKEEVREIERAAEESGFAEEARQAEAAAAISPAGESASENGTSAAPETEAAAGSPESLQDSEPEESAAEEDTENTETAVSDAEEPQEPVSLWPTFRRPTDIPTLRPQRADAPEELIRTDDVKLSAVNLEEIESGKPEVEFEKVELPEVEMQSEGGEAARRAEILRWLKEKSREKKESSSPYTPLSLDELIPEELPGRGRGSADDKRFTQTLSFNWTEADLDGK